MYDDSAPARTPAITTAAKQIANFPENMTLETSVSLLIVMDMENPLFVLKVMHEEFRLTWADAEDGGLAFDRIPMDISEIYPSMGLLADLSSSGAPSTLGWYLVSNISSIYI